MAFSMVSDPESEQELAESHLMLKDFWLCFRMSSSFVCISYGHLFQPIHIHLPCLQDIVVCMVAYATDGKWNSLRYGLAGEDRLSLVRRMSVYLQELLHVPDNLESLPMLWDSAKAWSIYAVIKFKYSICIDSVVSSSIICKAQIHVFAEIGKVVCKRDTISNARVSI